MLIDLEEFDVAGLDLEAGNLLADVAVPHGIIHNFPRRCLQKQRSFVQLDVQLLSAAPVC